MAQIHRYQTTVTWTGNLGSGTSGYREYSRNHEIHAAGKNAPIAGSSDPLFRGEGTRYNPEEMLVGALSACHMLWVLHLAADAGIVITSYRDEAWGLMNSTEFTEVTLEPVIHITDWLKADELLQLQRRAHELCFIANSVKFPVLVSARVLVD